MSKNKNDVPLRAHVYKNDDRQFLYELVIKISLDPWQNIFSDIECLRLNFILSIILYEQGCMKIFLNPSQMVSKSLNELIEKDHKKLKLENIESWSTISDTFIVYTKSDRQHLVLLKGQNTEPIFELFKEKHSPKVVSAKLIEILPNSNNCITFDEELNLINILKNSKTSVQGKVGTFDTSQVSLKVNTSKSFLICKRKVILPSSSWAILKCDILPLPREIPMNENFPQQVSEEQSRDERSVLLFPNGLSRPVTTDNTSGFEHDNRNVPSYSEQNTVSGEATSFAHNSAIFNGFGRSSYPAHGARYPKYIEFQERLASYTGWIHSSPDPNTLSKAGFFYTNDADLVRCFQCGIGLKDFCQEDDPLKEHVKHSGDCPYLVEVIGAERLAEWKSLLQAQDPEYNRRMQWTNRHNETNRSYTYRHPEYQTRGKRIETFANWPVHMLQRPEQLADAGLYYSG